MSTFPADRGAHGRRRARRPSPGVTLVELIVAIVIVGAAMAGLTAAIMQGNRASVDPILVQQKIAIAESLMGEILLKPYTRDPAAPAITAGVRDTFAAVADFNGYGSGPGGPVAGIADVTGAPVPGLENYTAVVAVAATAMTNVPNGDALRITITVNRTGDAAASAVALTGWRTRP